jgi:hypothetical protein
VDDDQGILSLSTERDVGVDSPDFIALGNPWFLRLFPGGRNDSRSGNSSRRGWVGIYLYNMSNESIDMQFGFSNKDSKGELIAKRQTSFHATFGHMDSLDCGRGWSNFVKRSTIIDSLVDGSLVVDVNMKPHEPIKSVLPQFIPENPFLQTCVNQKGIQQLQSKSLMYLQMFFVTFCTTFMGERFRMMK